MSIGWDRPLESIQLSDRSSTPNWSRWHLVLLITFSFYPCTGCLLFVKLVNIIYYFKSTRACFTLAARMPGVSEGLFCLAPDMWLHQHLYHQFCTWCRVSFEMWNSGTCFNVIFNMVCSRILFYIFSHFARSFYGHFIFVGFELSGSSAIGTCRKLNVSFWPVRHWRMLPHSY